MDHQNDQPHIYPGSVPQTPGELLQVVPRALPMGLSAAAHIGDNEGQDDRDAPGTELRLPDTDQDDDTPGGAA